MREKTGLLTARSTVRSAEQSMSSMTIMDLLDVSINSFRSSVLSFTAVWPNDEFPVPFVEGELVIPLLIGDRIKGKRRPFDGCLPGRPPQFDSFIHIGHLFIIVHAQS
ncbi:hypothetical protein RJ639_023824 [Escallonia herrerae]|uniref:Uncharacterized protein n=1 Tax=Escallonia herrerae TaxID=1293975 RepID=A0AA88V072_9ASTE|nr:hypothetical protein RJ639_023824 [Escallonia herrerae]